MRSSPAPCHMQAALDRRITIVYSYRIFRGNREVKPDKTTLFVDDSLDSGQGFLFS